MANEMQRDRLTFLYQWLDSDDRKPLIIRGARQVGKTWLAHQLAKKSGRKLLALNFEKDPRAIALFESNSPQSTLALLSARFDTKIDPQQCILFLDEIQAAPELLAKLRWFYEDMPELAVIAAGSLLEFTLEQHEFSMPVGRISYLHLEPMSFEEFMLAKGRSQYLSLLQQYQINDEWPQLAHDDLMALFKEYLVIGGMPAVVSNWIKHNDLSGIAGLHHDLLTTYRDDFAKYRGRVAIERLDELIMAIPAMLGQKFAYRRVNQTVQAASINHALDLLTKARVIHRVKASAGNGVPLGAEVNDRFFKAIFLDIGLANSFLGVDLSQLQQCNDLNAINQGALSEQVVGQLLRTLSPPYKTPELYCWAREQKGAAAKLDYLIQHRNSVVPIEVKSGSTGSLKSLHQFMASKQRPLAVRINGDKPSLTDVSTITPQGTPANYQLLSLPFYMIGQINRMLDSITS